MTKQTWTGKVDNSLQTAANWDDIKKTTIRIPNELWNRYMAKLFHNHGKTHGVINPTIVRLIEEYCDNEN